MKVLELFSGTGSVGKVCKEIGWDVTSLDIDIRADINCDILEWDYKVYKTGEFDIIWASPECLTFSNLRRSWIGRKLKAFGDEPITAEMLDKDMMENGVPLLHKTQEIIEYFKPNKWFIENPQSSKMKNFIDKKPIKFDYCMFDFPYKKSTNVWSNIKLTKVVCDKSHLINNKHAEQLGQNCSRQSQKDRYRIPPNLIKFLILA